MTRLLRLVGILVACGAAAALNAAPAPASSGELRVEPREQSRPTVEGLRKATLSRAKRVHGISLDAPGSEFAAGLGRLEPGVPYKIGISRDVVALRTEGGMAAALRWEALADGAMIAALGITSPEAAAVRIALNVVRLPDAAVLRFLAPGDVTLFEVSGAEVNELLQADAAAGEAAGVYWSPVIEGDTLLVEIEIPAGSDPREVRLALPRISHLVTSAATTFATPTTLGQSASCNVDASCSTGWSNQMNAVAQMIFSDGSGSYLCTGTLLADADAATNHPYFLSARHCISSQAAASSLATYWFYRSSACNSASPRSYQQLTGGATLLYSASATDTTFMRLNNTPPQGSFFAGWHVGAAPGVGSSMTALHQPRGDLLKISQGSLRGYLSCTAPSSGSFSCASASSSGSTFYDVGWTSGITEPGSSGSGLFLGNGYLIGQLYGGSSSCGGSGRDAYGRFDVAYNAGIKSWLSPALALSVWKNGTGSGTVTSAPSGISCGSTCSAGFPAGTSVKLTANPSPGSAFAGWSGACGGTGSCTVSMNAAASVTATFLANSATLSVSTSGSGTVTSVPSGITCGSTCSASFASGATIALTATPAAGMTFKGWSGACTGTSSCSVTMNGPVSVLASFGAAPNLALTQAASPVVPGTGKDLVFTLTAANKGVAAATKVVLTDTLPSGAMYVWASPGCTLGSGKVTCALGALAAGASAQVMVVVRPSSAGMMTNAASVVAAETDASSVDNTSSAVVTVESSPAPRAIQRYRLYSPVTQEHLFTTDFNEYNVLGAMQGTWIQEGAAGRILDNPGAFNGVVAVPYYRLYNSTTRWHHWTTDANEYYSLIQFPNWKAEGVDGYILPRETAGAAQLYRLLYPDGRGLHHWTTDATEYHSLVAIYGWIGEGGSGFVIR